MFDSDGSKNSIKNVADRRDPPCMDLRLKKEASKYQNIKTAKFRNIGGWWFPVLSFYKSGRYGTGSRLPEVCFCFCCCSVFLIVSSLILPFASSNLPILTHTSLSIGIHSHHSESYLPYSFVEHCPSCGLLLVPSWACSLVLFWWWPRHTRTATRSVNVSRSVLLQFEPLLICGSLPCGPRSWTI